MTGRRVVNLHFHETVTIQMVEADRLTQTRLIAGTLACSWSNSELDWVSTDWSVAYLHNFGKMADRMIETRRLTPLRLGAGTLACPWAGLVL